jgi:CRISPR-associated protein Cmr2
MISYDYWATCSFIGDKQPSERQVVDYLLGQHKSPYHFEVTDSAARVELLALALAGKNKEYARKNLQQLYQSQPFNAHLRQAQSYLTSLNLMPTLPDITSLPAGSFALHFTFTLAKPYLSRDDANLHLLDNPVKKEWIFKLPYISASQWKGTLRYTLWQLGKKEDNQQIQRLFGQARENESGQAGRLYSYPTFFERIDLELINPHDRKTGTGTIPILLESVPIDTTGSFTLLYFPFDRIGKEEKETRQEVMTDLKLLIEGIQAMLTIYGFGAKTSSGFGLARDNVKGSLILNYPDRQTVIPKPVTPQEPDVVDKFLALYSSEDLELSPKKWGQKYKGKADKKEGSKLHKQARAARNKHQEAVTAYEKALAEWETTAHEPPPAQIKREFKAFDELEVICRKVEELLNQEGGKE